MTKGPPKFNVLDHMRDAYEGPGTTPVPPQFEPGMVNVYFAADKPFTDKSATCRPKDRSPLGENIFYKKKNVTKFHMSLMSKSMLQL